MVEKFVATYLKEFLFGVLTVVVANILFFGIKLSASFGYFGLLFFTLNFVAAIVLIIMVIFFNRFERIELHKEGK